MKAKDFDYLHELKDEFEFLNQSLEIPDQNERLLEAKESAYKFIRLKETDIKEFLKSTIIETESKGEKEALDYYKSNFNFIKNKHLPFELEKATEEFNKEIAVFYRENNSVYRKMTEYTDLSQINSLEIKAELLSNKIYDDLMEFSKIPLSVLKLINFKYDSEMWIIHRYLFKELQQGSLKDLNFNKDSKQKSQRLSKRRSLKELLVSEKLYDRILKWLMEEEIVEIKNQNYFWTGPKTDKSLKSKRSLLHFMAYLSVEGYLLNDTKDIELKESLEHQFNLKVAAQNFSGLKNRVSTGAQSRKEQEYQDLFSTLPKP